MTLLYLTRHVKTLYNQEERYQGLSDSPISHEGQEQLKKFVSFFFTKQLDVVYSSPLKRSVTTASIISQACKIPLIIDSEFKEICYGTNWKWRENSCKWKSSRNN